MTNIHAAVIVLFISGASCIFFSLTQAWRTLLKRTLIDAERRSLTLVYMFHAAVTGGALFVAACLFGHEGRISVGFVAAMAIVFGAAAAVPKLYLATLYCRGFVQDAIRTRRLRDYRANRDRKDAQPSRLRTEESVEIS
jgi:hypothetical protein